jgi:predicted enzyme related to lactoylglutathione lyase
MTHTRFLGLILLCSVFFAATACQTLDLPPVSDSDERIQGKVIWRDLLTSTPAESRRFYTTLFGWQFETVDGTPATADSTEAYYLIRHKGQIIGGLVDANYLDLPDNVSQWISVVSVNDVETITVEVIEQGGTTVTAPTDLGRRGVMAIIKDNQGALVALLQTAGDPPDRKIRVGDFLWDEIWTQDADDATVWYAGIFGYEPGQRDNIDGETSYHYLAINSVPRVGILPNPIIGLEPVWMTYVRVDAAEPITAQVEALGGKIIVDPQPRALGGEVAVITGPSGAGIALQTWEGGLAE